MSCQSGNEHADGKPKQQQKQKQERWSGCGDPW